MHFDLLNNKPFLVIAFVALIICFAMLFCSLGYHTHDKIKPEKFISYMEKIGCEVFDEKEYYDNEKIELHYSTVENSCPYFISYLIVSDKNELLYIYDDKVFDVQDNPNEILERHNNGFNYKEYYTEGQYYKFVSRYKDSILYISTDISHKEIAEDVKAYFGYYAGNVKYQSIKIFVLFIMSIVAYVLGMKIFKMYGININLKLFK